MPKALFKTDQEWFDFIQRCRTSGMSDSDFCREQGVSRTSLYRHIRKLREKAYELPKKHEDKHEVVQLEVYGDMLTDPITASVEEVEEAGNSQERNESRIHIICGGFHVDIDEGADRSTLQDTLSILQKIC